MKFSLEPVYKKQGKRYVKASETFKMASDWGDVQSEATFSYAEVDGVLLPSKLVEVSTFNGQPGGSKTVRLRRVNVAERLYRVTGEGIYRDSVLLGREPPLREPLLAGGVLGQDSVVTAVLGGRLLWFWGDTSRAAYPLGNFSVSGAVSKLPRWRISPTTMTSGS